MGTQTQAARQAKKSGSGLYHPANCSVNLIPWMVFVKVGFLCEYTDTCEVSMKKRWIYVLGVLVFILPAMLVAAGESVELKFRYAEGDRYRILSTVRQNVFVNGRFSHSAEILNRLHITITEVDGTSGFIALDYESGESIDFAPGVYHVGNRYQSEFWRSQSGEYTIDDGYFVPVVRDVPIWPDHSVQAGDTWHRDGYEVHDFRDSFGIPEPYTFPVSVRYTYQGAQETEDGIYDVIEIEYTVFHRSPSRQQSVYPAVVTGFSEQLMYFDRQKGRPAYYEEEYDLEIRMNDGSTFRFAGTADARVLDSVELDRHRVRGEIQRELDLLDLPGVSVQEHERGVTIRLSDIRFPPDSAELGMSEQEKLSHIGAILQMYSDNDILITGHTALAGTHDGRQQLSEARAAAVGRYLSELGIRDMDRIIVRGMGADEPVASNQDEEGRRLNRRVELTIIED